MSFIFTYLFGCSHAKYDGMVFRHEYFILCIR